MSHDTIKDIVENNEFQGRPLSRWENHTCRLKLAKAGTYTYEKDSDRLLLIHHKLGHINWRSVAKHCRQNKIPLDGIQNAFCNYCLQARQKKAARGKPIAKNSQPKYKTYEHWSCDVWGPTKTPSLHNKIKYQLCFIDRNSNTIKSYPLSDLTQIPKSVAQWIHEIREDTLQYNINNVGFDMLQATTHHLRGDCATYFKSERMQQLCQREKIQFTFAPPDTHSKNAFAERTLQVIANSMKALCNAANLNKELYWPQAWKIAIQIKDFLPRNTNKGSKSPYEIRTGQTPPDPVKIYRTFGQTGMVHVPNALKLDDRARPAIVMGHDLATNATLVEVESKNTKRKLLVPTDQFISSKTPPAGVLSNAFNAIQEEDIFYENQEDNTPFKSPQLTHNSTHDYMQFHQATKPQNQPTNYQDEPTPIQQQNTDQSWSQQIEVDPILSAIWNKSHDSKSNTETQFINSLSDVQSVTYTLAKAKNTYPQYTNELDTAVATEVQGLIAKCLTPVEDKEISTSDEISTLLSRYTIKFDNGLFDKVKVRCCYRGQSEIKGIHFLNKETNMPKLASLRIFLALAPFSNEVTNKADISQAFLRAELEQLPANTRRFVRFPNDISPLNQQGSSQIFRLTKSLYGMRSAGFSWEQKLFTFLKSLNFEQNTYEVTLFSKTNIRVLVWVDDLMIRATQDTSDQFKRDLEKEFGDTKWQPLHYILGMSVQASPHGFLGVHSAIYINKMITNTNMQNAKPRHTPLPVDAKFRKISYEQKVDPKLRREFQSILGQLNYLATWSRPDLAYTTSALGSVASAPTRTHLEYAKHALAYTKTHPTLGLSWSLPDTQTQTPVNILEVYSDASFANERDYKSQSGFIAILNNSPIHWYSKKQEFPALSSSEAEIIAATVALKHTLFLKRLLDSMGFTQGIIRFHLDAQNAIRFFNNPKISQRNQHVGSRYFRIRYHINKDIELHFISTENMTADICTKNQKIHIFRTMVKTLLTQFTTQHQ
jgi:hypothetical protein